MIIKLSEKYEINKVYEDGNNNKKAVKIILDIDNKSKQYSIYPVNGKEFQFIKNSVEWRKWLAITNAIKQAIEYANKIIDKEEDYDDGK